MAFKEQLTFTNFRDSCMGVLNLKRIENMIGEGMPDVIGINRRGSVFWLELKAYIEWPKRASTCPLKGKFEKGQLGFMCSWLSWNGHAFVLLRVAGVYYLIRPHMGLSELNKESLLNSVDNPVAGVLVKAGKKEIIEYLRDL